MIVPVMAISNLVLTQQIYSEETNGVHAHNRDRVPLTSRLLTITWVTYIASWETIIRPKTTVSITFDANNFPSSSTLH